MFHLRYPFRLICVHFFTLLQTFYLVQLTEVTESNKLRDDTLGFEIYIPVLSCHAKYKAYNEVRWYNDKDLLLKTGFADLSGHILSLSSLLNNQKFPEFDHPLKLQGYYRCETDYVNETFVHRYLFRIKEVQTFVGWFIASEDGLGTDQTLSLIEKIRIKKTIYEDEMQHILFDFLPKPNIYATDIIYHADGLEVKFNLYVRQVLHPRQPVALELIKDQHELEYVLQYLNNETEVDVQLYRQMIEWTRLRGIDMKNITLSSSLGCYFDSNLVPTEPPRVLTWNYAEIGEIVIPIEGCSSSNGLAVTRLCTGSFDSGARWGNPSGVCDKYATSQTSLIRNLYLRFGDEDKSVYLQELNELTTNADQLTVTDIHIVTDILTELSKQDQLEAEEIDAIFSTVDKLMEINRTELLTAKGTIKLTSRVLRIIGNTLQLASNGNKEILISKRHLLVEAKKTKVPGNVDDHITGIAIISSNKLDAYHNSSVEFLINGTNVPKNESLAYFVLPPDLVISRERDTQCHVKVVFFRDWLLFPNPKDVLYKRNYKVLPTLVMYVALSGGSAWNMTDPVNLYFRDVDGKHIANPVCVHFDPRQREDEGAWSTEGCEYGGLKDGFHHCLCYHLSIFAVVLSERPDSTGFLSLQLGTAIYVGCGVSIIALSFIVLLYMLSKTWRSTVDHGILFSLALSFLCCLILLFISELKIFGCILMAFLLHYMTLVVFAWLLVQAVMHRLRFGKKAEISEIPNFMLASALCAWGSPGFIMLFIWFTLDDEHQPKEDCWDTIAGVSKSTLVPVGLILFLTLWINLCAIYAVTCRFQKDFLLENDTYDASVLKFRVAISIFFFFVLSWLFGFFSLRGQFKELKILFSISITITSYYLALFFVFHEISFCDMCCKWRRKNTPENDVVKFDAGKPKATYIRQTEDQPLNP